jgi:hypothetical protein
MGLDDLEQLLTELKAIEGALQSAGAFL